MSKKLFDFIMGNPPYQIESETESSTNGQKPRKNVFQYFQEQADQLSAKSSILIYPAGRWIHQSGKGLQQFGLEQINDHHLSELIMYPNSKDVFPTTDIPDGVSVVIKNKKKNTPGFTYTYIKDGNSVSVHTDNPGEELLPLDPDDIAIANKIQHFVLHHGLKYMHDGILPRSLFAIESDFVENNKSQVKEYYEGMQLTSDEIKIFTNDKAGSAGRSKWFVVNKSILKQNLAYLSEWQVVVSSAHPGGQDGRDNQMAIIDNNSAFGRARVALRSFKTEKEAINFSKYIGSKIVKYAFLLTDEALSSLAKRVPDLGDYSDNQKLISFDMDIDCQLANLLGLSSHELNYISSKL